MTKKFRETPMTMHRFKVTPEIVPDEVHCIDETTAKISCRGLDHDAKATGSAKVSFTHYHLKP